MGEREVHRVHAAEIFGVQHVLTARLALAFKAEICRQRIDQRVEHGDARHLKLAAGFLQSAAQLFVHQGEHDETGIILDALDDHLQLPRRPHQIPEMFDRLDLIELGHAGARDAVDRFPGRVRHQMQMELLET